MKATITLLLLLSVAHTYSGDLLDRVRTPLPRSLPTTPKPANAEGILKIGLERVTHHMNERPAFLVYFGSDGVVHYDGLKNVNRLGVYQGRIWPDTYKQLAGFVYNSDFFEFPASRLLPRTTDATQYIFHIKTDQGEKIVWDPNFPDYAQPTTWALGEIIDGLLTKISLTKTQVVPNSILKSWGYRTVTNAPLAQLDWQVKKFGPATGCTQNIKAVKEVPDWPKAYYRFILTEEIYPSPELATKRLTGLHDLPGKNLHMSKGPLGMCKGFIIDNRVIIVATDVFQFQLEEMPKIVRLLQVYLNQKAKP